jgi:hypothetical protein
VTPGEKRDEELAELYREAECLPLGDMGIEIVKIMIRKAYRKGHNA